MQNKFDLTTSSGFEGAIGFLKNNYVDLLLLGNPLLLVGKKIIERFVSTPKQQTECAKKLIEAGRREGADEMEITLDRKAGFHVNVPEEVGKCEVHLGSDEKIHLKVKYKR